MQDIYIPVMGMAPDDVTLVSWLKQPGDEIRVGDVVAVVETSKSEFEIESDAAGTLGVHRVAELENVAPGSTIAMVLSVGESETDGKTGSDRKSGSDGQSRAEPAGAPVPDSDGAAAVRSATVVDGAVGPGAPDTGAEATPGAIPPVDLGASAGAGPADAARTPHQRSPRDRRLEAEARAPGVAARAVASPDTAANGSAPSASSGPAVPSAPTAPPVPAAVPASTPTAAVTPPAPVPPPTPAAVGSPAPADRYRAAVATAVTRSWHEIPHFAVTRELRMDALDAAVREIRIVAPQVTLTDVLLRALALSFVAREDRTDLDIGLAVATERGVAIPVIRNVPQLELLGLAAARRSAVERARAGRSHFDDERLPVSTLSNLGTLGVDQFTGIVPWGQSSLLTVGKVSARPVVEDGRLAVGVTMWATLNVDHRVWDGQPAGELLDRLARIVGVPALLVGFGPLPTTAAQEC